MRGLLFAHNCTEAYTSEIGLDVSAPSSLNLGSELTYFVFDAMLRSEGFWRSSLKGGGCGDPSIDDILTKKGI